MARDRQPDNIFLTFENANTLSGNNSMFYYYREGILYIDGSENVSEPKYLNLDAPTISRTTRIKSRTAPQINGGIFITPEGESIPHGVNDEIYASHNYFGETNIDRDVNSERYKDSWWYDTEAHRAYKIYTVLTYTATTNILGTDYYDWQVANSYIVYKEALQDPNDGIYTFSAAPVQDLSVTASATFASPQGLNTWGRAELNLYFNNTVYTSSYVLSPNTIADTINIRTTIPASSISVNDTLKLSFRVDDDSFVVDPLIVTEYSMSLSTPGGSSQAESYLGLTTGLGLDKDPDCQPTLNNAVDSRLSIHIQDVDYSNGSSISGSGILLPQNINLLRKNQAEKASTPDSNYTQTSFTGIRYTGTKTVRNEINEYTTGEPLYNLGPIPNVKSLNSYIAYFNKIIDPYPNLNKKTALFVKYLVDSNSDIFDPSLSDINLSNFKDTFKIRDYDNMPTRTLLSIQNIDESKELKDLEETTPPVFSTGIYPSPILFSQNSSTTNASSIPLVGATNVTANGPWWSVDVTNRNKLNCVSADLINTYEDNYYMGEIPYVPGVNTDFPLGKEPDFTKFDPVRSTWSIVPETTTTSSFTRGDQFRFENNEDLSFNVINVDYTSSVSLTVTLDREVDTTVNPDFFLVRRFVNNPGFLILNIDKPYGFPVSASSSPGIVTPEYRVEKLEIDPDQIISSLIDKNLI